MSSYNVTTIISWRGNSGATHYERGSSENSHLLTLDYSVTGPMEIAVTFSSAVCNKTSSVNYTLSKTMCGTCPTDNRNCETSSETTPSPSSDPG